MFAWCAKSMLLNTTFVLLHASNRGLKHRRRETKTGKNFVPERFKWGEYFSYNIRGET
jgi:hypothetical protein